MIKYMTCKNLVSRLDLKVIDLKLCRVLTKKIFGNFKTKKELRNNLTKVKVQL